MTVNATPQDRQLALAPLDEKVCTGVREEERYQAAKTSPRP